MPLELGSRRVGHITVVTGSGRLVAGEESTALGRSVSELLPHAPYVVLNLADVDFIDSSGVGVLVRLFVRVNAAGGLLTLCTVSPKIREVLRVTRLDSALPSYESEADAVAAFYERAKTASFSFPTRTDVLCVEQSADALVYVREVLKQAGLAVVTADNLVDGLTLLLATRPRIVVVGEKLRRSNDTRTAERFNRLADDLGVVELPASFSTQDAGEAGRELLSRVHAVAGSPHITGD